MGWRRLPHHIAVGHSATAATASLNVARRAARPPQPPAWAAGALRRRQSTASTPPVTPASARMPSNAVASPLAQGPVGRLPSHPQLARESYHRTAGASGRAGRGTAVGTDADANPSPSKARTYTSSLQAATSSPPAQQAALAMRSHISAFDAVAPPPSSSAYAYVKSGRETKRTWDRREGVSAAADTLTCHSAKNQSVVSVEGEAAPIAAAPGAVRRALRHQSSSSMGDLEPSSSFPLSAAAAAAFQRLEHDLKRDADATHSGASNGSSQETSAAPVTPADRRARRERQRQTRLARESRRLERAQQDIGGACHPCRIQGGCRHTHGRQQQHSQKTKSSTAAHVGAPGLCPYRHFSAHHCVTQLRGGHCALHGVGCCPWTHGDVGDGVGRSSSVMWISDVPTQHSLFSRVSPLSAVESSDDIAALRQSSEKVGHLLRLCVDAVLATMEGATEEHQKLFLEGAANLSLSWRALRAALRAAQRETPTAAGEALRDDILCVEPLKSEADCSETAATWLALSLPADLAWCAMAPEAMKAQPFARYSSLHYEDNELTGALDAATPSQAAAAASTVPDPSPMSKEELVYWSGFFTYEDALSVATMDTLTLSKPESDKGGADEVAPTTATGGTAPSLRLTPCVSAWVLDAAAAHLRSEAVLLHEGTGGVHHRSRCLVPVPTSARTCFQHAALYLLGWRRTELRRFLRRSQYPRGGAAPSDTPLPNVQAASSGPPFHRSKQLQPPRAAAPCWAPVLFLRDLLMASYIVVARCDTEAAIEHPAHPLGLGEVGGVSAEGEACAPASQSADACDSLLGLFMGLSPTYGEYGKGDVESLVHRGSLFSVGTSHLLAPVAPALSESPQQTRHNAASAISHVYTAPSPRSTPNSAVAFSESFEDAWAEVHKTLLQLQEGLLECQGHTLLPRQDEAGTRTLSTKFIPSAVSLSSYLQPALLRIASTMSSAFALRYEPELRTFSGWQPWTDHQLFLKEHAAMYNAASYARHHLPAVRLGLHNSLLNSLLLLSTRHANAVFGLETSAVQQLLFGSPQVSQGTPPLDTASAPTVAARWWAAAQQSEHRFRQQHLQPCVSLSLGFLTALQELSRDQLATQQSLMQEYEQRRTAHDMADSDGRCSHQRRELVPRGVSLAGGTRTRKYHTPSREDQREDQRGRLEELRGVPLLDRLLPYGSATVSPDAAAALLRQLLEGGHPYKALKLAASIVHASRMLRHADRQPRPLLRRVYRTVHTRIWSRRSLRHVLVRKRALVLRLVGAVEGEGQGQGEDGGRPGAQSRRAVRPVGLVFMLSERVVVEMARVGLRMGEAGAALADGVLQDCLRGALVDFTEGRGLPAPLLADVEDALQSCQEGEFHETALSVPGASRQRNTSNVRSCRSGNSGYLLRLLGAGDGQSSHAFLHRFSPWTPGVAHRASLQEEEGMGAPHRRIAPTPLLLETLQGHTPPSSTTRHTKYLRFLLQDIPYCCTWSVLFTLQYQACGRHSRYATARMGGLSSAARAMQTVYVITTASLSAHGGLTVAPHSLPNPPADTQSLALPSNERDACISLQCCRSGISAVQIQLAQEAERMITQVLEWILSDPSSLSARSRQDAAGHTVPAAPSGPLRVKDVKSMLSRDAKNSDDSLESEGGEEAVAQRQLMRRAKLQLPVLLHHIWMTSIEHRSAPQRCTALWSVCAATLLGTSNTALRHAVGSGRSGCGGGSDDAEGDYLCLSLRHCYFTAGVQMRAHAPQQSPHCVDATVRVLLLSPALLPEEVGSSNRASPSKPDPEWPMLLSSARTPTVPALRRFVLLQLTLLTSLLTAFASAIDSYSPISRELLQGFVDAFTSAHGARPEDVRDWPAWRLLAPMLRHPALAICWLLDTFLCPSPSLLVWIVAAVSRTDAEGYAVLRTWLLHIPAAPQLTAELRQTLLNEIERRHRGAFSRQHPHRRQGL
ncbi:hypothetical protein ABL78_8069 [Leptomonas seymouri]|uniref:Uncharacterized protein n=1 Tax=Leptomonas seymouri TaxID=5684 RepID=A0A0N0P2U8_LEPSE|nr:hypothetical protein ABL78_8069 [Leptomonas seymouri]|eukprot:KPI82917.1 hypothetical protein ABL78_8069 [Leptomonas seymouri]